MMAHKRFHPRKGRIILEAAIWRSDEPVLLSWENHKHIYTVTFHRQGEASLAAWEIIAQEIESAPEFKERVYTYVDSLNEKEEDSLGHTVSYKEEEE